MLRIVGAQETCDVVGDSCVCLARGLSADWAKPQQSSSDRTCWANKVEVKLASDGLAGHSSARSRDNTRAVARCGSVWVSVQSLNPPNTMSLYCLCRDGPAMVE
jgi:hypothetical protein